MTSPIRKVARSTLVAAAVVPLAVGLIWSGPAFIRAVHAQRADIVMFVSVVDRNGKPVQGLSPDEFVVRENGVRREVLRVTQPATDPIDIALAIDNTAASSPYMPDIRIAVSGFISAMHANHFISLLAFAERPVVFVNYTHDLAQLNAGVGRLFSIATSGSTLLDALVDLSLGLAKRKAERAAIIVLSADGTEWSQFNDQQVLEAVAKSGASLNAIVINPRAGGDSNYATKSRMIVLDSGPKASGGVHFDVVSSMGLADKFSLLASQLANQYRVVYSRPEMLIPPDKFSVSVNRPGLEARGTLARPQSR